MKFDDFLTQNVFDCVADYVSEKQDLLKSIDRGWRERNMLGEKVLDAVSSWQYSDAANDLIEMSALAVCLDNAPATKALILATRKLLPSVDPDSSQIKAFEFIIRMTVDHHKDTKQDIDPLELKDVLESSLPLSPAAVAGVSSVLIDVTKPEKRVKLSNVLKTIIDTYAARGWTEDNLKEYADILVNDLSLKMMAQFLPLLRAVEANNPNSVAWFLKNIFSSSNPALLLLIPRNTDERRIIRTRDINGTDFSQHDLEDLLQEFGCQLSDYPHGEEDYYGEDFFELVASAHRNSKNWISARLNDENVVFLNSRLTPDKRGEE